MIVFRGYPQAVKKCTQEVDLLFVQRNELPATAKCHKTGKLGAKWYGEA